MAIEFKNFKEFKDFFNTEGNITSDDLAQEFGELGEELTTSVNNFVEELLYNYSKEYDDEIMDFLINKVFDSLYTECFMYCDDDKCYFCDIESIEITDREVTCCNLEKSYEKETLYFRAKDRYFAIDVKDSPYFNLEFSNFRKVRAFSTTKTIEVITYEEIRY